jgi:alkaline phosphatase
MSDFRHTSVAVLLVVLTLSVIAGAGCNSLNPSQSNPENVILMIPDGCGPASMTMARDYVRDVEQTGHRGGEGLVLDSLQVGSVHTYATDRRVTDSAAGATAYACGVKTYYTAVAVDTLKRKIATVLEGAEEKGMSTGLVATSRITHATPAAFSAHVASRYEENEIARQQLTRDIEVILGGGRRHFLPASEGGVREDGRNLLQEADDLGYNVVETRKAFDRLEELPVLGLFTPAHMSYEIDRQSSEEPSLSEMTRKALSLLRDSSEEGFFLMIEGSRIDHAGHDNDPAAHLREILEYDRTVSEVLSFARSDGQTLVVSVSDHETGGLSLVGGWEPDVLDGVTGSREQIAAEITEGSSSPEEVVRRRTGIELSPDEEETLENVRSDSEQLQGRVSELISSWAGLDWATGGHTAVDVNLYAYGPGSDRFVGHHDNTYIGRTVADLLGIDLEQLTRQLQEGNREAVTD